MPALSIYLRAHVKNGAAIVRDTQHIRKILRQASAELAALLVPVAASFIELAHIATTGWRAVYLYAGDSLTLPIIRQSLDRKEAIQWVFSSQLNLFPEGILYAIASIFTRSISTSLAINSVINIALFYIVIRLIMSVSTTITRMRQRLYSIACTLIVIGYMLLETYGSRINQTQATYFLFNTYYDGLVIIGLFVLYILLRQIRSRQSLWSKTNIALTLFALLLPALTIASDPLYAMQFTAPCVVVLAIFYCCRYASRRRLLFLAVVQALAFDIGMSGRFFLRSFIGEALQGHEIETSLGVFDHILAPFSTIAPLNPSITLYMRILINIVIYFLIVFYVLIQMNRKLKDKHAKLQPLSLFVLCFIAVEPLVLGVLLTAMNGLQDRYLITPILLPPIGLVLIVAAIESRRVQWWIERSILLVAALAVLLGLVALTRTKPLIAAGYNGSTCLAAALDYHAANGVSDYDTARALDVYGVDGIRVLQTEGVKPYAWLNNLASYENKQFSFAVVTKDGGFHYFDNLGKPSSVQSCPTFWVYQYAPGSAGYRTLNQGMDASLQQQLLSRKQGKIADYLMAQLEQQESAKK